MKTEMKIKMKTEMKIKNEIQENGPAAESLPGELSHFMNPEPTPEPFST
jgi:hypothetical protein